MKKYMLFAVALAALGSCADESFVGDESQREANENAQGAIVFGTGVNTVTRANGGDAAELLNNNFVLFGTKGSSTRTTVFNNYQANYVANTANTTESNSDGWEYVGYYNVPGGITATTGVTAFATSEGNADKVDQTIKYWDYSAPQYDFAAYSLGKGAGTTPTYAKATAINFENLGQAVTTDKPVYTLTGSADELKACYISDLVTAYNHDGVSNYGTPVEFSFRSLAAKIRIAFYETIPGYSVKDVKFYDVATGGTSATTPTLFTSGDPKLPAGSGTMKVYFPTIGWSNKSATDYNKAHVTFTHTATSDLSSKMTFDALADFAAAEKKETAEDNPVTGWIGRASNAATYAGGLVNSSGKYYTILPYETGANLQLRIKYTLVATDGYGETIDVKDATAVVPAELAKWQPNYAYTYIFKIGDMTNGSTGVDGNGNVVMGLTPITLDAVVVGSEDGVQETITTVSTPSITTYAQGKVVTANDEYVADKNIYVIVNNGTANETLTDKANLYKVTIEDGAAQKITEETVANAIAQNTDGYDIGVQLESDTPLDGYYTYNSETNTYSTASGTADGTTYYFKPATYSVKDAHGKKLVVNAVAAGADDELSLVNAIAAADSPTGNEITIGPAKVGKFTPAAGTTYAFQYGEAAGTYTAETAAAYNATLPGAITTNDVAYSFTSYADDSGNTEHGTGMVKVVSTDATSTTVEVVSNNPVDAGAVNFVGQQFKVNATTIEANTYYQLYTTGNVATGIYVKVTQSTAEEVKTYNATLSGAVSAGAAKPAKYQYKIIKVKS